MSQLKLPEDCHRVVQPKHWYILVILIRFSL